MVPVTDTGEERVTKVAVVRVQYERPTGQGGFMYVDPTWVYAVGELSDQQCAILVSTEWLTINMSAEAFLSAIGITPAATPAQGRNI